MSILLGGVLPGISGASGLFDFGISANGDTLPAPENNTSSRAFCFDRTGVSKTGYTGDIWWNTSSTSTTVRKYSWTGSAWNYGGTSFSFNTSGSGELNLAMTDVGTHVIVVTGGTQSGAGSLVTYQKSNGNVSTTVINADFNYQGMCYDPVNDALWLGHFDTPRDKVTQITNYLGTPTLVVYTPPSKSTAANRNAAFNYVDRRWMFGNSSDFDLYSGTNNPSNKVSNTSVSQLGAKETDFLRTPDKKSFLAIQDGSGLYFYEL